MASSAPIVLETDDISAFLQHVLNHHAQPSTLVICASKDQFLSSLEPSPALVETTLRRLALSRTLRLAFCPDVTHLRAYLSVYSMKLAERPHVDVNNHSTTSSEPILAILDPIRLHSETTAFSAQGLNRTFATAVEAAHNTGSKLIVAECPIKMSAAPEREMEEDEDDSRATVAAETSPWDQEVSILNVTTKSFGVGERGWSGRTVSIQTVAERYFTFQRLEDGENMS